MAGLVQTARAMRERLDHLIQELVDLENELAWVRRTGSFDMRMEPRAERNRVGEAGELCTCLCVCSAMNPALWSALPIEVLHLVFARLPLPKILQLRCLSREWNRSVIGGTSEFIRECIKARPARAFALIPFQSEHRGLVSIRIFDTQSNQWHSFLHQVKGSDNFATMSAGDGGLVCVVSTETDKEKFPLRVTVFNPLTRQSRSIPVPTVLSQTQPSMVKLVMDHDAKCYKVLVVGEKSGAGLAGSAVAMIYCSRSGVWFRRAEAFPDLMVFGLRHEWYAYDDEEEERPICSVPCAYDCSRRQYLEFNVYDYPFWQRSFRVGDLQGFHDTAGARRAFVKDRLFVLHEELLSKPWNCGMEGKEGFTDCEGYCVSEYQGQKLCRSSTVEWVRSKVHLCDEIDAYSPSPHYSLKLYACEGLLLVKATSDDEGRRLRQGSSAFRHELTWLYDMSTETWREIPGIPPKLILKTDDDSDPSTALTMIKLRWDAIP